MNNKKKLRRSRELLTATPDQAVSNSGNHEFKQFLDKQNTHIPQKKPLFLIFINLEDVDFLNKKALKYALAKFDGGLAAIGMVEKSAQYV